MRKILLAYLIAFAALGETKVRYSITQGAPINAADKGAKCDGSTDDTVALQRGIDASYGRRLILPSTGSCCKITAPLVIQPAYNGISSLPISIQGEGFDANGGGVGNRGSCIQVSGAGDGIQLINNTGNNSNNEIVLSDFSIVGDGTNVAGGNGITAKLVNNLVIRNMWVQDMRGHGISVESCFGATIEYSTILRSRKNGIYINKVFNNAILRFNRVFASGRNYNQAYANIWFDGSVNFESLGTRIEATDWSYAGTSAFQKFKMSDGTITSIVVAAGVATVTTNPAHNLVAGNLFTIASASTNGLDPHPYSFTVATAPTSTTFTFATTAANGTYNLASDPNLLIQPSSYGMFVSYVRGLQISSAYAEDTADALMYLANSVNGLTVDGGYFQGQNVSADTGTGVVFRGIYFAPGQQSPISGASGIAVNSNYDVDVATSNVFGGSASFTKPTIFKRDGKWFSNGVPAIGTWAQGDLVWNTAPAAAGAPGWVCTTGGTPGTWKAMANLAP